MENERALKVALLGGDMRLRFAAKHLAQNGYRIITWNVPDIQADDKILISEYIYDAMEDADAIVLPLPCTVDGRTLNCATGGDIPVTIENIISKMNSNSLLIGGRIPENILSSAMNRGIRIFDYFTDEELQIKNAYTTAEAAISIAMSQLLKNIRTATVAVTGYGRISRQLVRLLRSFGAEVTVCARKASDLTLAELEGCHALNIIQDKEINKLICGYDIIFNTVPCRIFDTRFISKLDRNTLLIELASAPGCVDISEAKANKIKILWASSLPGKYAPQSAGADIAHSVIKILRKEGA